MSRGSSKSMFWRRVLHTLWHWPDCTVSCTRSNVEPASACRMSGTHWTESIRSQRFTLCVFLAQEGANGSLNADNDELARTVGSLSIQDEAAAGADAGANAGGARDGDAAAPSAASTLPDAQQPLDAAAAGAPAPVDTLDVSTGGPVDAAAATGASGGAEQAEADLLGGIDGDDEDEVCFSIVACLLRSGTGSCSGEFSDVFFLLYFLCCLEFPGIHCDLCRLPRSLRRHLLPVLVETSSIVSCNPVPAADCALLLVTVVREPAIIWAML